MIQGNVFAYYRSLSFEKNTFTRAIRVAILVGIILILINNPEIFISFSFQNLKIGRVLLTFLVPYCVSTYSSVLSNSSLKPGNVSPIDALLKCKSCRKTNFQVHIGQSIEECTQCKGKTRWSPKQIFSWGSPNSDVLKSLALFARHNPQPLFRIDATGIILGANPASEVLFAKENLNGENLNDLVPEINALDLKKIIEHQEIKELIISINQKFYNIILKGVPVLNSLHVYGNDISQIVMAEAKIKSQAKEINESIQYAWFIQKAMLPDVAFVSQIFPHHFVFYLPKNTVSGDFYWVNQVGNIKIVAVADCTGHGVPGAFMSMLGISLLNEIILRERSTEPDKILNILRDRLRLSLSSRSADEGIGDGMDISVAVIHEEKNSIHFAGAFNPLYLLRQGELIILEADRMPVGKYLNDHFPFTQKTINYLPEDRIFLFTDGYKDQIGGDLNKKYLSMNFKDLLIKTGQLPVDEQLIEIKQAFTRWKNVNEQVDDVLVLGIKL